MIEISKLDTDSAGYQRLIIRPMPPSPGSNPEQKPIDWVKAHYDSIHGRIATEWKRDGDSFDLKADIPANTTATVYIPARERGSVRENGQDLAQAKGVKFLRMESDRAVLSVESGSYHFTSKPL